MESPMEGLSNQGILHVCSKVGVLLRKLLTLLFLGSF